MANLLEAFRDYAEHCHTNKVSVYSWTSTKLLNTNTCIIIHFMHPTCERGKGFWKVTIIYRKYIIVGTISMKDVDCKEVCGMKINNRCGYQSD